jgi:membrane-associated phospholipid phosphatase
MSGAVAAVILIVLVLGNWHFVSDVIAGGYLGCLGAFMITMLWQSRPATERRADVR